MKIGVQGMSKNANAAGPAKSWRTESRSWAAVFGFARSAGASERRSTAVITRPSSRPWMRAPARASTRPRMNSSTPIIAKSPVTRTSSATSVSSERLVSTRS